MRKFEIVNKGNRAAEILFYGEIYNWGKNSSENLSYKLRELDKSNDTILIRMNSGGGSVVEAAAIYSTIKSLKAEVTIVIEGIAASAASFILLAANKVQMGKASRIMLHKFSGFQWGNSDDLREAADMMDDWESDWIKIYAEKMKMTPEAVKSEYFQRGKDTWISPTKAKELNLIDEIVEGVVTEEPANVDTASPAYAEMAYQNKITNSKSVDMNKQQLAAIGLPENATQAEIDARLSALALAETALKNATPPAAKPEATKEDPEKAALQAKLDKIEGDAREKLIQNAIDSGKIIAESKPEWEAVGKSLGNEKLESMLSNISKAVKPTDVIEKKNTGAAEYEKLEDLFAKGEAAVAKFKKEHPTDFNKLWVAHYDSDYVETDEA